FDPNADDAANYGAAGMVIGHELTHGFDDEGRQFDFEGNLKDWWEPQDDAKYRSLVGVVDRRYSQYEPLPGLHVNGSLTLGENIADNGGLRLAWEAFNKSIEGKPRPIDIDGYSPEQRFFLAFAQSWRRIIRPEALRVMVASDPHSPSRFRVLGSITLMP